MPQSPIFDGKESGTGFCRRKKPRERGNTLCISSSRGAFTAAKDKPEPKPEEIGDCFNNKAEANRHRGRRSFRPAATSHPPVLQAFRLTRRALLLLGKVYCRIGQKARAFFLASGALFGYNGDEQ